ncbi:hypothetical protein [Sulfuricurvum sp.]|uniref:hypothetical protein n=1 Tax=Sulfuricurvum sp. TaxID=2025608 RepID=UPI002E3363E2|nr:hypothetical protein [Sulfuricurvum sp.]HEX5330621.1 hypothetical protein [Sulfuricurvum sp.]
MRKIAFALTLIGVLSFAYAAPPTVMTGATSPQPNGQIDTNNNTKSTLPNGWSGTQTFKSFMQNLVKYGFSGNLFVPIQPILVNTYTDFNESNQSFYEKKFDEKNATSVKRLLMTQNVSVVTIDSDKGMEMALPTAGASLSVSRKNYLVIMDYMKYRTEPLFADTGHNDLIGYGKIGVGLRVQAKITAKADNVNLGSLMALGIAAHNNDISGEISIEVIGMDSNDITNLLPITASIDQSSIQSALQAMAAIKTKLNDPNTTIQPHLVAFYDPSAIKLIQKQCSFWDYLKSASCYKNEQDTHVEK